LTVPRRDSVLARYHLKRVSQHKYMGWNARAECLPGQEVAGTVLSLPESQYRHGIFVSDHGKRISQTMSVLDQALPDVLARFLTDRIVGLHTSHPGCHLISWQRGFDRKEPTSDQYVAHRIYLPLQKFLMLKMAIHRAPIGPIAGTEMIGGCTTFGWRRVLSENTWDPRFSVPDCHRMFAGMDVAATPEIRVLSVP